MANNDLIHEFLDAFYGDEVGRVSVWWRPEPGSKSPYSKSVWFDAQDRTKMAEFISGIADKDVCVTTATYSVDRRIPDNVSMAHIVWMDSDVCSGDHYRIEPSWTVTTSEGRWQHFWQLEEPADAMRVSELVHRISIAHDKDGADPSSWPANKIMRVPGTMNTSHGFPMRVKATAVTGALYGIEELEAAYSNVSIPDRAAVRDLPDLHEDELPTFSNVLAKLSPELLTFVTDQVPEGSDRSRRLYKMLLELFRAGLTYEEVLSAAWHSPGASKWNEEDSRGLHGLAGDVAKAAVEAGTPSADPVDPFSATDEAEDEMAIDKPVVLLTEAENELLISESNIHPTFIHKYLRFAEKRLPHPNRAYDRLNAWMTLSLAFLNTGYIPDNGRKVLNFFGMTLGETTSGKTSSFRLQKSILREMFHDDPEYNLGGNATESALVKALHAREGQASYFNSDEASGVLKVWVGQDWASGMRERITELYDGDVNPLLRSSRGESMIKTTRASLDVFLAGTQRGIMEYMTADLFQSGFIPRFIVAIGNPQHTDYNTYKITQGDADESLGGFDPIARQLAVELDHKRKKIREFYAVSEVPVLLDDEAAKRIQDAAFQIDREYRDHAMWDMIKPSIQRWKDNVHKAACLLALDRGEATANIIDVLYALQAGEEWFTNMLRIISRLNANSFERACGDIYGFVNSKGGKVGSAALFRRFKNFTNFEMQGYLVSLNNQNRVYEKKDNGRAYYYSDIYREDK